MPAKLSTAPSFTAASNAASRTAYTKSTTVQQFLAQPRATFSTVAHDMMNLDDNASSGRGLISTGSAPPGIATRRRTSSMLPASPSLRSTSPRPFSPPLSPPTLSPLGSPLLDPRQGLIPSSNNNTPPTSSPRRDDPDESDSDWYSESEPTDSGSSLGSNSSRKTLTQFATEGDSVNHAQGLDLFADIPLVQEVQEYSDTDSFMAFRNRVRDSDDRSIRSNSTDASYARGPLFMSPPGTPVIEEENQFFDGNPGNQTTTKRTSAGLGLGFRSTGTRKVSVTKLGHSFVKALEAGGRKLKV
ncbi:hypothetical protein VKT23_018749 [Stygiomarasmius scandens]|uniref:Uncharacterized protein n=1 Tax=Marasmiellus scandens TaxID=2682957 RepID=A0ABR1IR84_9AGAR